MHGLQDIDSQPLIIANAASPLRICHSPFTGAMDEGLEGDEDR